MGVEKVQAFKVGEEVFECESQARHRALELFAERAVSSKGLRIKDWRIFIQTVIEDPHCAQMLATEINEYRRSLEQ